jgi:O-methyltransferase involved in polyketide biosynthesis
MQENTYPVSDTAALVMLWAEEYYRTNPLIRSYLDMLDLSAGHMMHRHYNRICPWYSEVIINRKHFIRNQVESLLASGPGRTTVINLGAGYSPLALEISGHLSERCRFLEIDRNAMTRKHRIYARIIPSRIGYVSCTAADIGDTESFANALERETALARSDRVIVVMEGLTYYIGRQEMARAIGALSDLTPVAAIIFEHLKPCRLIDRDRRYIPYSIFSHVRDYVGMDRMTTYSRDDIVAMCGNRFAVGYADMDTMERLRTGTPRYFPGPGSGWLSCAVATRTAGPVS